MTVENDKIELECAPRVAEILQRQERDYLDSLEKRFQKSIIVVPQKGWKPDQFRVAGKMSTEIAAEAAAQAAPLAPRYSPAAGGERPRGDRGDRGGGGGAGNGGRRRRRGGRGRDRASA
jgi:hypothetical protein